MKCKHRNLNLINPFELIRKYYCEYCCEIMMCQCDEKFGKKFFSHQLDYAVDLKSQNRLPVTIGFQKDICRECRGLQPEAYPKEESYEFPTKIRRYYWREIFIDTIWELQVLKDSRGDRTSIICDIGSKEWDEVEKKVIKKISKFHEESPKYLYKENPQSQVIEKYEVEVINIKATYVRSPGRKARILKNTNALTVEDFVSNYFQQKGYRVIFAESRPFHVIFSVFLHRLIQDPLDENIRECFFSERSSFRKGESEPEQIWTFLPTDFGTIAYSNRRHKEIESHLNYLKHDAGNLSIYFKKELENSFNLRQYLWAHEDHVIEAAREMVKVLPVDIIIVILKYLVENYWDRYLGWPDLFIYHEKSFFFVEVKSSKDKLSQTQKKWIRNNDELLNLPFKIVKIHRQKTIDPID